MDLPAGVEYAGFWRRVAASLIDTVIMVIILGLALAAYGAGDMLGTLLDQPFPSVIDLITFIIIVIFWVKYAATPGKMLLDCRIVDSRTGKEIRAGQSIIRYFGYILSTIPLLLGFVWVAFSERKQGFHDMVAHTVVLHSISHIEKDKESEKSVEELMKNV